MTDQAMRDTNRSLRRGWQRRCPRCGRGHVLEGYLTVRETCDACSLDFTPQRADDGPAYVTILIVGHLMVPGLHIAYAGRDQNSLVVALVLSAAAIGLSLVLLPRIKGAMIAYQWANAYTGSERDKPLNPNDMPKCRALSGHKMRACHQLVSAIFWLFRFRSPSEGRKQFPDSGPSSWLLSECTFACNSKRILLEYFEYFGNRKKKLPRRNSAVSC